MRRVAMTRYHRLATSRQPTPRPNMNPIVSTSPQEILGPLNDVERKNAPPTIYAMGDLAVFGATSRVSIVGTRKPSPDGLRRAASLCQQLVARTMVVVSGLAEGIDTVAHSTAIAGGGRTIAIVGNGLDKYFPPSNRALQEKIGDEHLLLSQFGLGVPPRGTNFPQRNRTMALLTDATIIIEAGDGSGTIHQGWEALRLGRPLFLLESLTKRTDLAWPAEMMKFGAAVLTRENLPAVLDDMPVRPRGELAF